MSASETAAVFALMVKEGGVSMRSISYFWPGLSRFPPNLRAFVAEPWASKQNAERRLADAAFLANQGYLHISVISY
jgi:hypothetical protein